MSRPLHEKIQRLLKQRKKRKKDLADHLGIAPQTMTDICKGRSAVTLRHLKGIVSFFQLGADYWLDDEREEPDELDRLSVVNNEELRQFKSLLSLGYQNWSQTRAKLQRFIQQHRRLWVEQFGPVAAVEAQLLGIPASEGIGEVPAQGARAEEQGSPEGQKKLESEIQESASHGS